MTNVEKYLELTMTLLVKRAFAGGTLSQDQEAECAQQLDLFWQTMTSEEQEAVEKMLVATSNAPEDLFLVDSEVDDGKGPRKNI